MDAEILFGSHSGAHPKPSPKKEFKDEAAEDLLFGDRRANPVKAKVSLMDIEPPIRRAVQHQPVAQAAEVIQNRADFSLVKEHRPEQRQRLHQPIEVE